MHKPFIETQFPLAVLSAESYKERMAVSGQTLTGLGKWWGRKPLILVRAVILGLLMPASEDPAGDREVFLRILTMDEDGLWRRKTRPLKASEVVERTGPEESAGLLDLSGGKAAWLKGIAAGDKARLERLAFNRMDYEEKLDYCLRPEQIDGPGPESWEVINRHLGTAAADLAELFDQLSRKAFGRTARVGDCFCGGGSIPFEAARLGLESYGSDLSPVAALLSWAAVNLVGGGTEVQDEVRKAQEEAWEAADRQITAWGIEHDGEGNRADSYLYCVEAKSPATGLWVPLAPSWVISEKYKVVAELKRSAELGGYDISIVTSATDEQMAAAKKGTVQGGELVCPETGNRYGMAGIRGDRRGGGGEGPYGLRLWENEDLVPRPEDVFQERLYCVRWVTSGGERLYKSVTNADLAREEKVLSLLKDRFTDWQEKGYIPSMRIHRGGDKTEEPIRTRGWTHWHHLFHPRQLLTNGLVAMESINSNHAAFLILEVGRIANWNSKNCRWLQTQGGGIGGGKDTFDNQAINTLYNYVVRGGKALESAKLEIKESTIAQKNHIFTADARLVSHTADLWITDPPYADAVNYHELADFFLAWYEKHLPRLFPEWYADGRAALAVRGAGEDFKRGMVEIYTNLAAHTSEEGLQVVMFTHQNAGVWADLGMILWAAGLEVTAAWTVGTETTSGLKVGNYVQGTVLMVLRKRREERTVYLDELYPLVEDEVKARLDDMRRVDDSLRPQFGDTDYQLAAYAAALQVLTAYADIEGMDIRHELFRSRKKNQKSPFEVIIHRAVSIAASYLVPRGIESHVWVGLLNIERLYLRGLELERHGEMRHGAYQELARGFGVPEYKFLLAETAANRARFRTPSEFGRVGLADSEWGASLLRHLLFAVHQAAKSDSPKEGLLYIKAARPDYWIRREDIVALLEYLSFASRYTGMSHWKLDGEGAALLKGLVANDYGGSAG